MCSSTSILSPSNLHITKITENASALQASARVLFPRNQVQKTPYVCISHVAQRSKKPITAVACGTSAHAPQDENNALETVLKLYEAIRSRNHSVLSDIIAEECMCVSNFVSAFRPFLGKKQVLAFFSSLMKSLGKHVELVVQQTLDDGMVVTVSWKLEWRQTPLPLGRGFSLHMCHAYQGKVMIKNVKIFLEPGFHKGPLRLVSSLDCFDEGNELRFTEATLLINGQKLILLVMTALEKFNPRDMFTSKIRRVIVVLFILLLVGVIVFLLKT